MGRARHGLDAPMPEAHHRLGHDRTHVRAEGDLNADVTHALQRHRTANSAPEHGLRDSAFHSRTLHAASDRDGVLANHLQGDTLIRLAHREHPLPTHPPPESFEVGVLRATDFSTGRPRIHCGHRQQSKGRASVRAFWRIPLLRWVREIGRSGRSGPLIAVDANTSVTPPRQQRRVNRALGLGLTPPPVVHRLAAAAPSWSECGVESGNRQ